MVELIGEERLLAEVFGEYPEPGQHLCSPEKHGELKERLREVMGTLPETERRVLEELFGLNDGLAKTRSQVKREFERSGERIRQITAKALRRLRHPSRSQHLKDFFLFQPSYPELREFERNVFEWVKKRLPLRSREQQIAIHTRLCDRLMRIGISRFSRLQKFSEKEAIALLNLKRGGTVTEQCLRAMWQKANKASS